MMEVLPNGLTNKANINQTVLVACVTRSRNDGDAIEFFEIGHESMKSIAKRQFKTKIRALQWLPSKLWDHGEEQSAQTDSNYLFVSESTNQISIYNTQFQRTGGKITQLDF
jgi:hypothetical protein